MDTKREAMTFVACRTCWEFCETRDGINICPVCHSRIRRDGYPAMNGRTYAPGVCDCGGYLMASKRGIQAKCPSCGRYKTTRAIFGLPPASDKLVAVLSELPHGFGIGGYRHDDEPMASCDHVAIMRDLMRLSLPSIRFLTRQFPAKLYPSWAFRLNGLIAPARPEEIADRLRYARS